MEALPPLVEVTADVGARSAPRGDLLAAQPSFAKLSRVIAHAPHLFQSLPKGVTPQFRKLEYVFGELTFTFIGPQLGVVELRVLQGLVGLAGGIAPSGEYPDLSLLDKVRAFLGKKITITTSYNELARTIGYLPDSGSAQRLIRCALEKLYTVAVFVGSSGDLRSGDVATGHFFSPVDSSESGGLLKLDICAVLAVAVLGGPGDYLRVSLIETRRLKTDVARLVHHRLHWINPGQHRDVGLDTLTGYVWSEPSFGVTQRKRRERIRDALAELKALGWTIKQSNNLYRIGRPVGTVTPTLPERSRKPVVTVTSAT